MFVDSFVVEFADEDPILFDAFQPSKTIDFVVFDVAFEEIVETVLGVGNFEETVKFL